MFIFIKVLFFIMSKESRAKKPRRGEYNKGFVFNPPDYSHSVNRQSGHKAARPTGPETKYFDVSFNGVVANSADWTGTEVVCTNYVQSDGSTVGAYTDSALIPSANGTGYGMFQNNKYYLKQIRVRGVVRAAAVPDSADVHPASIVRLVLIKDNQPGGNQAQGEDVFADMGVSQQCNFSFLKMSTATAGRFQILADEWVTLQPAIAGTDGANTVSQVHQSHTFSFKHKFLKPIQVLAKSNSTTPTTASLANCNIFLLAHCDNAYGETSISGCSRAYFTD